MNWEQIREEKKQKLESVLKKFSENLKRLRSNTISVSTLQMIEVKPNLKLSSLASFQVVNNRQLLISVRDKKNVSLVSKIMLDCNLGYSIEKIEGNNIHFSLLLLTLENIKLLIKDLRNLEENAKKEIRKIRESFRKSIKSWSENLRNQKENEIEKIIQSYQEKIEKERREKEVILSR